jgi:hypothetical protein
MTPQAQRQFDLLQIELDEAIDATDARGMDDTTLLLRIAAGCVELLRSWQEKAAPSDARGGELNQV